MNKPLFAFLLTLGAGLSTILGAFTVFIAKKFRGRSFRKFVACIFIFK